MLALLALALGQDPHPGQVLAEGSDCAACHVVPGVATPSRTGSCDGCHEWVRAVSADPAKRAKAMQVFPRWARYEKNVVSYFDVPDLGASFARLEPDWIARYLADPHDLRPQMPETMVRLGLDPAEIADIAAWAGKFRAKVATTPAPSSANVARGEQIFRERGCGGCHDFGARSITGAAPAAPDLRWARERMSNDMIAAWILDPRSVSAAATMPALGLGADDAVALRDFLVLADPGGATAKATVATATAPSTPPRWDDVESRVFGKICTHCHMDPAQNEGRRGPGNAGGFGWPETGLELQTYASVVQNRDRIVAAIERRYAEEVRDHVKPGEVPAVVSRPALPGMPLGLPALPAEDFALVKAWYAAGAPE